MNPHIQSIPQLPKRITRAEALRVRVARSQEEYERIMLDASATIHDCLQKPGPPAYWRDEETGRICSRDIRLQEALRVLDEISPPEDQ